MKTLVLLATVIFGLAAHASPQDFAHISKTFPFAPANLQKVEQAMQTAAARTGDAMKEWAIYPIDNSSEVRCAEQSPIVMDGHLYGCVLEFKIDLGGGTTATLDKMLYVTQSSADVDSLLKKTDVNKVDHVDLASPFDGGNGSTYYCNAEGAAGSRAWACYMNIVD